MLSTFILFFYPPLSLVLIKSSCTKAFCIWSGLGNCQKYLFEYEYLKCDDIMMNKLSFHTYPLTKTYVLQEVSNEEFSRGNATTYFGFLVKRGGGLWSSSPLLVFPFPLVSWVAFSSCQHWGLPLIIGSCCDWRESCDLNLCWTVLFAPYSTLEWWDLGQPDPSDDFSSAQRQEPHVTRYQEFRKKRVTI